MLSQKGSRGRRDYPNLKSYQTTLTYSWSGSAYKTTLSIELLGPYLSSEVVPVTDSSRGEIKGMAIEGRRDGDEEMVRPLVEEEEKTPAASYIWMVVLSTAVAVSGSFEFGVAVGFSSPSQAQIVDDLGLSLAEYSLFGSIITVGAMVGAIMSGRVADIIGRKRAMIVSDLFCIVGWLPIIFLKDIWWFDLGRLFVGFGIGLLSYVVPVYIAEITPKELRGGFTTVNQLMICGGVTFAFLLGTVLSWRTLAFIGTLPCLLQLFGLLFIPESPRWLANTDRENEFESALQKLRGKSTDISQEVEDIKEFTKVLNSLPRGNILELFQKRYRRAVIVGVGLMAFQQFGGINGVCYYTSSIFVSAGFSSGRVGTVAYALLQFPMTGVGALLMDKSGRRPLLLVSATGTCVGLILVTISFLLESSSQSLLKPFLALAGILIYIGSFSLGMGGVPWIIMSEIFPINMKGAAGSLVTLMNWFGAWVISYAFNFLMAWSTAGTFFVFMCICGLSVVFVAMMVPETKGRTLEEIQASMNAVSDEKQ